jgi:hypothetical protein
MSASATIRAGRKSVVVGGSMTVLSLVVSVPPTLRRTRASVVVRNDDSGSYSGRRHQPGAWSTFTA